MHGKSNASIEVKAVIWASNKQIGITNNTFSKSELEKTLYSIVD